MLLKFIDEGNDSEMFKMKSIFVNFVQDKLEENVYREVNELDLFIVNFEVNKEFFEKVKNYGIGNLIMNDQSGVKVGFCILLSVMRVFFYIFCKIIFFIFGFEIFFFLSVVIDGDEYVVVVDLENNNIFILNRNGDFLRRFIVLVDFLQFVMMFLGVVFFKDKKDFVVVNGVLDVYIINLKEG